MLHQSSEDPRKSIASNNYPTLIWVCAWCPKETYPVLSKGEEFTHGMCRKHFAQFSNKRSLLRILGIAVIIEYALDKIDRSKKRPQSIFSQTIKYFEMLKAL